MEMSYIKITINGEGKKYVHFRIHDINFILYMVCNEKLIVVVKLKQI